MKKFFPPFLARSPEDSPRRAASPLDPHDPDVVVKRFMKPDGTILTVSYRLSGRFRIGKFVRRDKTGRMLKYKPIIN